MYLVSPGVYTTHESQADGHVAEVIAAVVGLPTSPASGATIIVDGTKYIASSGSVILPNSMASPQFKIGNKYYSTLATAMAAAGITDVKAGFTDGTH